MLTKEFKKLLESELLTDDVKKELKEAVETYEAQLVESTTKDLEVAYAKKMQKEKEELAESLTALIVESVEKEVNELKEDISQYKDLEVTYATKLEEFKKEYSEKLQESFKTLVESNVKTEIDELREDLKEAKELNLGRKIFEAFKETYAEFGTSPDIKEIQESLENMTKELEKAKVSIAENAREKLMEETLKSLSGSKRKVMKTILEGVNTDKIEERYNETIEAVLKESDEPVDKKKKDSKHILESDVKSESIERIRKLANIS